MERRRRFLFRELFLDGFKMGVGSAPRWVWAMVEQRNGFAGKRECAQQLYKVVCPLGIKVVC